MTQSSPPSTPPELPGGAADPAALATAGDLADDGRVLLRRSGTAGPDTTADLCAFLFGPPGQIAEVARLANDLTLDPISGRHLSDPDASATADATTADSDATTADSGAATSGAGAGAAVIACVYRADAAPVLVLQVGDGPVDPDLPGHPTIVDADGMHAVLSYAPDHVGATIDPATARAWLTAAIGRVALTGTG
jgi:hypothetical protein